MVVIKNLGVNLLLMGIFVWLSNEALKNGLEETLVVLALGYGIITVVTNLILTIWEQK